MRLSKKITVGASIVIVLVNVVVLNLVVWRFQTESRERLAESARSFHELVLIVRSWVANHGGVYVRPGPGVEANPYLPTPGVTTAGGETLYWRNPAMVTRDLSSLASIQGKRVRFHLTSLDPLNPENAPDEFERNALLQLAEGTGAGNGHGEITRFETIGGVRSFRYFTPVHTEESCLSCHAGQGYEVGDVRGGLSIIMAPEPTEAGAGGYVLAVAAALVASGLASGFLFWLIRGNVVRPLKRLEDAAEEIGNGNFETEILATGADEIGDVGRAMSRMQEAIHSSMSRQIETEKISALGHLSAGIAHEIRNPLFAIRNDLDYLQRHGFHEGTGTMEVYGEMEEGLDRIGKTVNAVLGYARGHPLEFAPQTVDEVLERAMALMRKQIEREGVRITVDLDPDLPLVEMDIHQLEQVVINLLSNSLRACDRRNGEIRVRGRRVGSDGVELEVEDNGQGIDPEDLSRVFDPFYTRATDGTGLGLTIVRQIVEQHHGVIVVASEPDRGSTFTVRLPMRQPEDDRS